MESPSVEVLPVDSSSGHPVVEDHNNCRVTLIPATICIAPCQHIDQSQTRTVSRDPQLPPDWSTSRPSDGHHNADRHNQRQRWHNLCKSVILSLTKYFVIKWLLYVHWKTAFHHFYADQLQCEISYEFCMQIIIYNLHCHNFLHWN